jgi:hypothetical protein
MNLPFIALNYICLLLAVVFGGERIIKVLKKIRIKKCDRDLQRSVNMLDIPNNTV